MKNKCPKCQGNGGQWTSLAQAGTVFVTCSICRGRGEIEALKLPSNAPVYESTGRRRALLGTIIGVVLGGVIGYAGISLTKQPDEIWFAVSIGITYAIILRADLRDRLTHPRLFGTKQLQGLLLVCGIGIGLYLFGSEYEIGYGNAFVRSDAFIPFFLSLAILILFRVNVFLASPWDWNRQDPNTIPLNARKSIRVRKE